MALDLDTLTAAYREFVLQGVATSENPLPTPPTENDTANHNQLQFQKPKTDPHNLRIKQQVVQTVLATISYVRKLEFAGEGPTPLTTEYLTDLWRRVTWKSAERAHRRATNAGAAEREANSDRKRRLKKHREAKYKWRSNDKICVQFQSEHGFDPRTLFNIETMSDDESINGDDEEDFRRATALAKEAAGIARATKLGDKIKIWRRRVPKWRADGMAVILYDLDQRSGPKTAMRFNDGATHTRLPTVAVPELSVGKSSCHHSVDYDEKTGKLPRRLIIPSSLPDECKAVLDEFCTSQIGWADTSSGVLIDHLARSIHAVDDIEWPNASLMRSVVDRADYCAKFIAQTDDST
ncbi:hypothetical protein CALVIDRAFT_568437 [Calocera viscosa TUFC12733]|uniref:Uncharacterized protein n=1 Tax=Calocera viscosa (strain TUFC12733) TaxID=1330018 RepID=A0A167H2L9_CALVF|nr:hypothetical protein CALVIDRAFT_568437 [Calocera viscosa TUFC12733]